MTDSKTILIIDDAIVNRNILNDLILAFGHKPLLAQNGLDGLSQMKKEPVDLVLLDILMPVMNGYKVLEHIKNDETLRHIPVIMITAVDEMESVVKCIENGADDYLVKPFNPTLLKARIGACLGKKHLHDQEQRYQKLIEKYNVDLEEQVRQKSRELAKAHERLSILDRAKSDFLALISHELRTPLTGILGAAEMLSEKSVDDTDREKYKEIYRTSRNRLLAILEEALLLAQIEVSKNKFPIELIPILPILEFAIELTQDFAKSRQVSFSSVPDCKHLVFGENKLLIKACAALLKTAVRFSKPDQIVEISYEVIGKELSLNIQATGRNIPEEVLPRFFEVFSIAEPITPGGDLGLGPAIAERIIKLFDGTVTVKNRQCSGVVFTVKLKLAS